MKNKHLKSIDKISKNNYIKAKDLSSDVIQLDYKQKVLDKKRNCLKSIIEDIKTILILFTILGTFFYFLFRAEEVNSTIPTTIFTALMLGTIFYIGIKKAITIPKRISNYKNFNFERTCYAKIINKYTKDVNIDNRTSRSVYYIDAKINDNQYVKELSVGFVNYFELKNGDTIIIVSFDGHKIQAVPLNTD